jgi:hypothetical protein
MISSDQLKRTAHRGSLSGSAEESSKSLQPVFRPFDAVDVLTDEIRFRDSNYSSSMGHEL